LVSRLLGCDCLIASRYYPDSSWLKSSRLFMSSQTFSPADGFHVNTQMIEGPTAVVIFDGQLLLPYAGEVASYVQTLGKPVDRIILSHAHTDHWSGLQVLTERFPDAGVFALDGVADQLRARGSARLDSFRPIYGDRIATKVTIPTETITEGVQRIDGVTYDFKRFLNAESDLQLAALLPKQKVLMAFDLVFSPNEHAFTLVDHFDHWVIILESLKALQGYDTITIGHDTPSTPPRSTAPLATSSVPRRSMRLPPTRKPTARA
jgi:hypothetical protein